jgi:NADH:ubiquinone oxidoreductase subunit K
MMDFLIMAFMTLQSTDAQNYDPITSGIGFILLLIQLEMLLLSNFQAFLDVAKDIDDTVGSIFAIYILVLGACEAALALSLVVSYYRLSSHLMISL